MDEVNSVETVRSIGSPGRGVLFLDETGVVRNANHRAVEVFGVPVSQLIGCELPSAIKHRITNRDSIVEEVLEGTLIAGTTYHRYSTPIYDHDGFYSGRIEIYSDITVRRELENEIFERNHQLSALNRQLEEAQEQLIQSERLRTLGEMAAGVAHDINNVLGIILGNAQMGLRKTDPNDPVYVCLKGIELAARDAANTVHRLREIGRPVDTSTYTSIDMNDIVRDVVGAAFPAMQVAQTQSDASIHVDTDLTDSCIVLGNATELREALTNLFLNAVQSIDESGRINIVTECDEKHVFLKVTDTGAGMDEETQRRLFDPFYTTRGADGTGLGMSMVDAISLRHRGKVLVKSTPGQGTTVTIRLPRYGGS